MMANIAYKEDPVNVVYSQADIYNNYSTLKRGSQFLRKDV